ncbi:phytase [Chryseolinea lacunae]|uniref:Phytase n=1 Tax=Chryseolinea lacunae TaxID=2801331 RepID=A0ABS1KWQ2_9BACT|nr:phytase [Chryseolinea lacunae]MBL0743896.1 phytase [Chryseolinea lacunae]
MKKSLLLALVFALPFSCRQSTSTDASVDPPSPNAVRPPVITDTVPFDSDDVALWLNPDNPEQSLVLGTDRNANGGLYAFGLQGKMLKDLTLPLKEPGSVDVAYGFPLGNTKVDIAAVTETLTSKLRIVSLPDLKPIDGAGIDMFVGEQGEHFREPLGVALYKHSTSGKFYAFVTRKSGPTDSTYVWQYLLEAKDGTITATVARKFGTFSAKKKIDAIAVDAELGYVYYADEGTGVRKYHADPDKGNAELALFAGEGFAGDQKGISIYKVNDGTGYILVSDQQAHRFQIFPREGAPSNPHQHTLIKTEELIARHSDGSDVSNATLNPTFQAGMFLAMSADRTFQLYRWEDIAVNLKIAPNGVPRDTVKNM